MWYEDSKFSLLFKQLNSKTMWLLFHTLFGVIEMFSEVAYSFTPINDAYFQKKQLKFTFKYSTWVHLLGYFLPLLTFSVISDTCAKGELKTQWAGGYVMSFLFYLTQLEAHTLGNLSI